MPEPKLGIDEVGIPRHAALELYKPFVVAEMTVAGFAPLMAQEEIKKGTKSAFDILELVIKDRPILLKRDPLSQVLYYGLHTEAGGGKAIQIHPLVTGGYNADFDGDTMAGTVPLSREAVEEAKKMFPSKNLFSQPVAKSCMPRRTKQCLVCICSHDGETRLESLSLRRLSSTRPSIRAK